MGRRASRHFFGGGLYYINIYLLQTTAFLMEWWMRRPRTIMETRSLRILRWHCFLLARDVPSGRLAYLYVCSTDDIHHVFGGISRDGVAHHHRRPARGLAWNAANSSSRHRAPNTYEFQIIITCFYDLIYIYIHICLCIYFAYFVSVYILTVRNGADAWKHDESFKDFEFSRRTLEFFNRTNNNHNTARQQSTGWLNAGIYSRIQWCLGDEWMQL